MTQFLILVGFGAMVWAGGVTILYIMACRERDELTREAQENSESAKFYSEHCDRQREELTQLRKENARIGTDLWLCRGYAQKLRAAQGRKGIVAGEVQP